MVRLDGGGPSKVYIPLSIYSLYVSVCVYLCRPVSPKNIHTLLIYTIPLKGHLLQTFSPKHWKHSKKEN